jgi:hypothetical protein
MGDPYAGYKISFLPGQRLSSCTCPGEAYPGPVHRDGSFTARAAPEIDVFEAEVDSTLESGAVSQSAQFAPFNGYYRWDNQTYATYYGDPGSQKMNSYRVGAYQQAGSVVPKSNQGCYQVPAPGFTQCYATYGFQYKSGFASDGGQITWINDNQRSWKLDVAGFGPDTNTGISARLISKEPMVRLLSSPLS